MQGFNGLESFRIIRPKLHVDEKTMQYWRGFGMPVYLFAIISTFQVVGLQGEQLKLLLQTVHTCADNGKNPREDLFL